MLAIGLTENVIGDITIIVNYKENNVILNVFPLFINNCRAVISTPVYGVCYYRMSEKDICAVEQTAAIYMVMQWLFAHIVTVNITHVSCPSTR